MSECHIHSDILFFCPSQLCRFVQRVKIKNVRKLFIVMRIQLYRRLVLRLTGCSLARIMTVATASQIK